MLEKIDWNNFELISVAFKGLFRDNTIIVGKINEEKVELPLKKLDKKTVKEYLTGYPATGNILKRWKEEKMEVIE